MPKEEFTMLYFIGGPARVGKTTLAARLMRWQKTPFIPADVLTHALDETYPQLGIRKERFSAQRKLRRIFIWRTMG